jgi:hypothetical protein
MRFLLRFSRTIRPGGVTVVECLDDPTLDLVYRLCAVNRLEQSTLRVVAHDLRQAILEDIQPSARHTCPIVATTALFAASDNAPDQLVRGNIEVQRPADRATMFVQPRIERLRLRQRAREPVENGPPGGVRLLETCEHKVSHHLVRYQLTLADEVLVRPASACA